MADAMAEIEDLKKKLSANPDSMIFVPLADAYRKAGLLDDAIDVCKAGLEKHPSYTSARVVLGRIYSEKDMIDEAIEELKKVETVDVDNIMVHSMLGNAFLAKKRHAEAIEQFQRVLSLNPDDTETQDKLQEALSAKQTPQDKTPEKAPEPKKEEPSPKAEAPAKPAGGLDVGKNMKVAELYTKKEEFDKAIEIYREILEHDNENMIIQQRLREVYDLQGKKIKNEQAKAAASKPAPAPVQQTGAKIDTDKITAEDILDVMKEAVEDDKVDEPEPVKAAPEKVEEKKAESSAVASAKAEVAKEVPKTSGSMKVEKTEAPKKDLPAEPKAKAEDTAVSVDDNKKKEVESVLKSFSDVDGMIGSFFLLRDGTIVSSVLPSSINANEIGKTVATIVDKTEKSVSNMDQGKLNQVVISSESGQLLFTEIGKGVLFMIGDANINVGKMGLMLKNVIGKLKSAVG